MNDTAYFRARRHFLTQTSGCLGMAAVASLMNPRLFADGPAEPPGVAVPGILGHTHNMPRAKNVIYLFMAGGPSHIDLFDYKPILRAQHGHEMPASVLGDQRVTGMTRNQGHRKTASTPYRFRRVGRAGHEMTELFRHLPAVADELCVIKSVHTEPINHDPAIVFMQAGRAQSGLPCMGAWISYGLGSENRDLPSFVVMISGPLDQPLSSRHYHSGFLPAQHQGVQFQSAADPVFYLTSPDGISREVRAGMVDGINDLNRLRQARVGDPDIEARIHSFELAFRMQTSVPELVDVTNEPQRVLDSYGPEIYTPGSFARHCLLARRLVERGVRFVQLFHRGWDQHSLVVNDIRRQVQTVDQPYAALLRDLKHGTACSTIPWSSGAASSAAPPMARATSPAVSAATTIPAASPISSPAAAWKAGLSYGANRRLRLQHRRENRVHVNDLHATMLHLLGVSHERLTYRYGGRDFRLTDVAGNVVRELLG